MTLAVLPGRPACSSATMRLLTDNPAMAAAFLLESASAMRRDAGGPTAFDRALTAALGLERIDVAEVPANGSCWTTLVVVSETDASQFDAIDRVLASGERLPGPVASVAMTGTRFHGHRGRSWAAARGNLHVSVAMPLGVDAADSGIALSMLPAVAAVDAIAAHTRGALVPAIKWVNDVVIGERKVGGVLTAARVTGRTVDDVIWGIGVNVEVAPGIVPDPFVPGTTCLREHQGGEGATAAGLFRALLDAIEHWQARLTRDGPRELSDAYRSRCAVLGREVQVWDESACAGPDPAAWGRPFAEGVVAAVADDLSLRLEGQPQPVTRGRLALRAPRTT